jgi:hypothetical protein
MKNCLLRWSGFIALSFLLAACGHSGVVDQSGNGNIVLNGIVVSNNAGLSGATVNLSGASTASINTDANGNFVFNNLNNGSYVVTPSLSGYSFSPSTSTVNIAGGSAGTIKFTATPQTFVVSGTISGNVFQNVAVSLYTSAGFALSTAISDVNGIYSFTGLGNGTYQLIPALNGYSFSPVNTLVTVNGANSTGNNFVSSNGSVSTKFNLSGALSGAVVKGVTISLYDVSGVLVTTTLTDINGLFSFTGLSNGSYTVIPVEVGYSFNPVNRLVTINGSGSVTNNFTSTAGSVALTFNITGAVSGDMPQGAYLMLYDVNNIYITSVSSDVNGLYGLTGLSNGTYTIIPSRTGYTFSPVSKTLIINGANSALNNFVDTAKIVAPTEFSIAGSVTGDIISGVNLKLYNNSGVLQGSTVSDVNGIYSFVGFPNGTYKVIPSLAGYGFNPSNVSVTVNGANSTGSNFISSKALYTISGNISFAKNVLVTLSNTTSATTTTDANGNYSFAVYIPGSYTITPTLSNGIAGYTYSPTSMTVTLSSANITGNNFVGTFTPSLNNNIVHGTSTYICAGATVILPSGVNTVNFSAQGGNGGLGFSSYGGGGGGGALVYDYTANQLLFFFGGGGGGGATFGTGGVGGAGANIATFAVGGTAGNGTAAYGTNGSTYQGGGGGVGGYWGTNGYPYGGAAGTGNGNGRGGRGGSLYGVTCEWGTSYPGANPHACDGEGGGGLTGINATTGNGGNGTSGYAAGGGGGGGYGGGGGGGGSYIFNYLTLPDPKSFLFNVDLYGHTLGIQGAGAGTDSVTSGHSATCGTVTYTW